MEPTVDILHTVVTAVVTIPFFVVPSLQMKGAWKQNTPLATTLDTKETFRFSDLKAVIHNPYLAMAFEMTTVHRAAPYVVPTTLTVTIAPHLHLYLAVKVLSESSSCSRLYIIKVTRSRVCLVAKLQSFTAYDIRVSTFEPTPLPIILYTTSL